MSTYSPNLIPDMTSNTTPSGSASASSTHSGHFPYYAFSSAGTWRRAFGANTGWVSYTFGSPVKITKYALTNDTSYYPRDWQFQALSAGGTWVTLHTVTANVNIPGRRTEFTFTNNTSYTSYRINITNGWDSYDLGFARLEMMSTYTTKNLIKSLDKIYTFLNNSWVEVTSPLNQATFLQWGFDNPGSISHLSWSGLQKPIELYTWTDNSNSLKSTVTYTYHRPKSSWLEITTDNFSPILKVSKNEEFEVLRWTDNLEISQNLTLSVDKAYNTQYLVSLNKSSWSGYNGNEWKNSVMTKQQIMSLVTNDWKKLFKYPFKDTELYLKILIKNQLPENKYLRNVVTHFKQPSLDLIDNLVVTTPDAGYKFVLNETSKEYDVFLDDGMAFIRPNSDPRDFYTKPGNIKIKPLNMMTLIGGRQSLLYAFEVESGFDVPYKVTLSVIKDGVFAEVINNSAYLRDHEILEYRTKIEVSLNQDPFSSMYPCIFNIAPLGKKIVYIRITPQQTSSQTELFQIKLNSYAV